MSRICQTCSEPQRSDGNDERDRSRPAEASANRHGLANRERTARHSVRHGSCKSADRDRSPSSPRLTRASALSRAARQRCVSALAATTPRSSPRGTAYIFTTTDCPIANRYAPEIRRLARAYSTQGIRFALVYVNPRETDEAVARACADVRLPHGRRCAIPAHALVKQFGITVTPETAIVDPQRSRCCIAARIDDRYVDVGIDRQTATRHDFADALRPSVAAGRSRRRRPGRRLHRRRFPARHLRAATSRRCSSTSARPATIPRAGAVQPADLRGRTPARLAHRVRDRAPLHAAVQRRSATPGTFVGQKRLTDDGDRAAPAVGRGRGARRRPAPTCRRAPAFTDGWQLGTPDLVVTTAEPFVLQAERPTSSASS